MISIVRNKEVQALDAGLVEDSDSLVLLFLSAEPLTEDVTQQHSGGGGGCNLPVTMVVVPSVEQTMHHRIWQYKTEERVSNTGVDALPAVFVIGHGQLL